MLYKKIIAFFFIFLSMITIGFAEDVQIIGSIKYQLKQDNPSYNTQLNRQINLLQVRLAEEEKNYLKQQAKNALSHQGQFSTEAFSFLGLPEKIALGMNKVPVLNQGIHGTCVTFAVTAAIDALLGKGDYVSQLCSLQLGSYFAKSQGVLSGWNGTRSSTVISQMTQYGIINQEKQKRLSCGGLYKYPRYSAHSNNSYIEPEKFQSMSELIFGKQVNWSNIYPQRESNQTLIEVKQALNAGDRLVFGVLVPHPELGVIGAVGKYKTIIAKDSWVLTSKVLENIQYADTAHEMIITGYDDNAVAIDNLGTKHKGLLFLRNSWGMGFGNYGDFYMSYDYFKLLVFDIQRFYS